MKKISPKVKEVITIQDRIDAIDMISDIFFTDIEDENDSITVKYTPYLKEVGQVNAIVRYFLEGIELDKTEDVYDEVMKDEQLLAFVNDFMYSDFIDLESFTPNQKMMWNIMSQVSDIVEYKKKENIARIQNEANTVLTYKMLELMETEREKHEKEITATENLNAWVEEQRQLNSLITPEMQKNFAENFDMDNFMDVIIKKYTESDLHKRNKEVVEVTRQLKEKDNKIVELQAEYAKHEQQLNARSVLADEKSKTRKPRKTSTKSTENK